MRRVKQDTNPDYDLLPPQQDSPPAGPPHPGRQFVLSTLLLVIIVACAMAAALAVAAGGGVIAGQNQRNIQATQTTVADLDVQYSLGINDLQQGRYELAALRFRWIIERVPDYPGAAQKLAEAESLLAQGGGVPSVIETPVLVPLQSPEELFAEAQDLFNRQDWENAIIRLQQIQALDPAYQQIQVREMLYQALATLGLSYIRGDRIQEGLVLLEQAEAIRPLDDQTAGERYFASLYITGRTYWGLSWPVVIQNFQALYDVVPNYRDVASRLREAYTAYGDQLTALGAHCDAAVQYEAALNLQEDDTVREKYRAATEACANPTPTPSPTPLPDASLTPPGEYTP
jgi:tetratricopeptide (TPR) repeat protein